LSGTGAVAAKARWRPWRWSKIYDNPQEAGYLTPGAKPASLVPDIERVRRKADRQPSRDAKVLPGRNIRHVGWDQTDPPNKSLTGIFRRPL
jgi:hypothetical protein